MIKFIGPMDGFSVEALKHCKNEIENFKGIKLVVLYFRDVPAITGEAITMLTQIQWSIRSRSAALSICSMKPPLREKLLKMAVIRPREISDNLQVALQMFISKVKN